MKLAAGIGVAILFAVVMFCTMVLIVIIAAAVAIYSLPASEPKTQSVVATPQVVSWDSPEIGPEPNVYNQPDCPDGKCPWR